MSYPTDKLWIIFRYLVDSNDNPIPVFMGEKTDSDNPTKYIVIQEQQFDEGVLFGDCKSLLRNAEFQIYVNAFNRDDLNEVKTLVIDKLKQNDLYYKIVSNIYDQTSRYYTVVFEGSIDYGE